MVNFSTEPPSWSYRDSLLQPARRISAVLFVPERVSSNKVAEFGVEIQWELTRSRSGWFQRNRSSPSIETPESAIIIAGRDPPFLAATTLCSTPVRECSSLETRINVSRVLKGQRVRKRVLGIDAGIKKSRIKRKRERQSKRKRKNKRNRRGKGGEELHVRLQRN